METLIELEFLDLRFSSFILLSKSDRQFPVEQFEAAVSQSTVPSPPLDRGVEAPRELDLESGPDPGAFRRAGVVAAVVRLTHSFSSKMSA